LGGTGSGSGSGSGWGRIAIRCHPGHAHARVGLRGLRRGLLRWHRGGNAIDQIQWREVQFVDLGATLVRARLAVLFCAAAH